MKYYAPVYTTEWKSTRDDRVPAGTPLFQTLTDAFLWFVDRPRDIGRKPPTVRRTAVVLVVAPHRELANYLANQVVTVNKPPRANMHIKAVGRVLPTAEDFLVVTTEREMLKGRLQQEFEQGLTRNRLVGSGSFLGDWSGDPDLLGVVAVTNSLDVRPYGGYVAAGPPVPLPAAYKSKAKESMLLAYFKKAYGKGHY